MAGSSNGSRSCASSSMEEHSSEAPLQEPTFVQLHPKHKPTSLKRPREGQDQDGWDNIEGYMSVKLSKLRNQFENIGTGKKSSIFEGVCIYVNGWTNPCADELKQMMFEHGGRYEYNFYSRSMVTHTIASNLPNSKIQNLGSSIVCTPDWIVDSIKANSCLPIDNYLLYKRNNGQKKLGFFKEVDLNKKETLHEEEMNALNNNIIGSKSFESEGTDASSKKAGKFVREFFTHSRLHHLSIWSTELKQFTSDMIKQITPTIPKLPRSASLRGLNLRGVVHIDLDCFFVSVSIRDKPHLRGKPVAITHATLPKQDECRRQNTDSLMGPHFQGKSVSVTHTTLPKQDSSFRQDLEPDSDCRSGSDQNLKIGSSSLPLNSTSDVASCSYEARDVGVSNGMSVGEALRKCPHLVLLPYDFEAYRKVSQIFYEICLHYSSTIEAVSCDETYLELTEYCRDFEHLSTIVKKLRDEIQAKTGCTVSAGISHNMLLARICTRVAKPDGQFFLPADKTVSFLDSQRVRDLPGVGRSTAIKLKELGVENCEELRSMSLDRLQSYFGTKTGKTLHNYTRGIDNRELKLTAERKSISVDINFGIRFKDTSEAETLLNSMSEELQKRAEKAGVSGNQITLKMKIRKQDAPVETKKYLGHGACDNVSRSLALLEPSREARECKRLAIQLLKQLKPIAADIRGIGLQLSKLVSATDVSHGSRGDGSTNSGDLRRLLKSNAARIGPDALPPDHNIEPPSPTKINSPRNRGKNSMNKISPSKSPFKSKKPKSPFKFRNSSKSLSTSKDSKKPSPRKSLKHFFGSSSDHVAGNHVADRLVAGNCVADIAADDLVAGNNNLVGVDYDLPPPSQLDLSVLEALPSSLCDTILKCYVQQSEERRDGGGGTRAPGGMGQSYKNRVNDVCSITRTLGGSEEPLCEGDKTDTFKTIGADEEEIIIYDEDCFLSAWKDYISHWVNTFLRGPIESDVREVSNYLRKLAKSNLLMAELCLKRLRRLITLQELLPWCPCFNNILKLVQEEVRTIYGGTLKITELYGNPF